MDDTPKDEGRLRRPILLMKWFKHLSTCSSIAMGRGTDFTDSLGVALNGFAVLLLFFKLLLDKPQAIGNKNNYNSLTYSDNPQCPVPIQHPHHQPYL